VSRASPARLWVTVCRHSTPPAASTQTAWSVLAQSMPANALAVGSGETVGSCIRPFWLLQEEAPGGLGTRTPVAH
jgi:hypothetical protein